MALPPKRMPDKRLRTPQPNAGVTAAYERLLRQMARQMGQDYLSEVMAAYRQVRLGHIGDGRPDQPRDSRGRWIGAGAYHEHLQQKYSAILDRLEKEDANPPPYGAETWSMGKGGYDTRNTSGLSRPIVLGEIPHPENKDTIVPILLREGAQDTSEPAGSGYGRRHIEFRHGQELRDKGFKDAADFARYIVQNHDLDLVDRRRKTRVLAKAPEIKSSNARTPMAPIRLHEQGDHYSVSTAYRGKWRDVKKMQ